MKERRLSKRLKLKLPVSQHGPGTTPIGETGDISRHGLFIKTEVQKQAGELVQFWLQMPDNIWIQMLAIVARQGPAGLGLRIHMLGAQEKTKWDRLLDEMTAEEGGEQHNAPRHRMDGTLPRFLVRPRSESHLARFARKELSAGGMFLRTPLPQPTGAKVELLIVHPVTDQSFPVIAHVVLAHETGPLIERGNGLTFEEKREQLIASFLKFCTEQEQRQGSNLAQNIPG